MDLPKKNPKTKQKKPKPNAFISITYKRWQQIASKVCACSQTISGISTMLFDEFGWCKHSFLLSLRHKPVVFMKIFLWYFAESESGSNLNDKWLKQFVIYCD